MLQTTFLGDGGIVFFSNFLKKSFFQSPYYWPSQHHTPDNIEYAIYLYKRAQRNKKIHGLEPGLPVRNISEIQILQIY